MASAGLPGVPQQPTAVSSGGAPAGGASSFNSSSSLPPSSGNVPTNGANGTAANGHQRQVTEQDLARIVKALEVMQAQGMPQSDPKFQTLLALYRNNSHLLPRSSASAAPAQPPVAPSHTGVHLVDNSLQKQASAKPLNGPFTIEQLQQLRAQILAYKYLSRSMALPPALLAAIRNPGSVKREGGLADPTAAQQQQQQQQEEDRLLRLHSPNRALGSKGLALTSSSRSKGSIAGVTPSPLAASGVLSKKDAQIAQIDSPAHLAAKQLLYDRERRVSARIDTRLEELRQLLHETQLPDELRLRALIEEKQLKVLALQKKVRQRIAAELRYEMQLAGADDPALYRRSSKKHTKQTVSKSERQKEREEQRKQQRQKEFCVAVVNHARVFREFHSGMQQKWKKVSRAVVTYHTNLQKRKQALEEKNERDRLRALKDNNIDEYMRLLNETKSARVRLLLEQTEKYLKSIEDLVTKHQQDEAEEERREREAAQNPLAADREEEAAEAAAAAAAGEEEEGKGKEKAADGTEVAGAQAAEAGNKPEGDSGASKVVKKTYYTVVHRVEEEIQRQPEILVGGQLKPYQMVGLNWLVSLYNNHLNGILADEMGLGKTIQTISLVCYLMESKGVNGPFLVVVPLSTLSNWVNEFDKWAPSVVRVVYKGGPAPRKQIYQNQIAHGKFNVVITTYDYIIKDKSALGKIKWNYIIIDEGHRMKNHACKLVTTFGQFYKARHRLLLTGTPLQNSLPELWSLLNFLLPSIFNSIENFEEWFNAPFAAAGEKVEMNEEESLLIINRLHKVLRPFLLRRLKKQVEDQLPDKVEKLLKCGFSAWQKRMYRHMREQKVVRLEAPGEGGKGSGFRGLMNTLMQLRKICNHPYIFNEAADYPLDENLVRSAGKFELLDRIFPKLKATGHRVLLFSQMTALLSVLEDYFRLRDYQYLRLDGSTKADERADLLKLFNAPDSPYFVFILSTRAGGLGLNLQTADTVVLFDSDWNPHADLQAQDRAHRIGQKHEVRVYRLVTVNSVEERILARAHYKLGLDKKIIEAGMFNKKSNATERKSMLEEIMRQEEESKDDLDEDDIPTDKEVNEMLARTNEEFELFQRMDKERAEKDRLEAKRMGRSEPLPRLMADDELPEWLRVDTVLTEEDPSAYGRGHRRKAAPVTYDDGLTESQWEKLLEEGGDEQDVADMREKNLARRAKRQAALTADEDQQQQQPDEEDEEDDGNGEAEEAAPPPPRKRSRKETAAPAPPTPRGGGGGGGRQRQRRGTKTQEKMKAIWEAIATSREAETGRQRSKLFLRLPSKKLYPDYYEIIKRPLSLNNIKTNIDKGSYTPALFKEEFNLIFDNAQLYNIPDCEVYQDAVLLQKLFHIHWEQQFGANANNDDDAAAPAEETTPEDAAPPKARGDYYDPDADEDVDDDLDDNATAGKAATGKRGKRARSASGGGGGAKAKRSSGAKKDKQSAGGGRRKRRRSDDDDEAANVAAVAAAIAAEEAEAASGRRKSSRRRSAASSSTGPLTIRLKAPTPPVESKRGASKRRRRADDAEDEEDSAGGEGGNGEEEEVVEEELIEEYEEEQGDVDVEE